MIAHYLIHAAFGDDDDQWLNVQCIEAADVTEDANLAEDTATHIADQLRDVKLDDANKLALTQWLAQADYGDVLLLPRYTHVGTNNASPAVSVTLLGRAPVLTAIGTVTEHRTFKVTLDSSADEDDGPPAPKPKSRAKKAKTK